MKICILFGVGVGDRYSLRISLLLVLVGIAGLYFEIINAFDYIQGARKIVLKLTYFQNYFYFLKPYKIDVDCIRSRNKHSIDYIINFKDAADIFKLSFLDTNVEGYLLSFFGQRYIRQENDTLTSKRIVILETVNKVSTTKFTESFLRNNENFAIYNLFLFLCMILTIFFLGFPHPI